MKIAIYQIDRDKDAQKVAFLDYLTMNTVRNGAGCDRRIYDKVFEGAVKCKTLSEVYMMFNTFVPDGYRGRSLTVSDVVHIVDTNEYWYCDSVGWKKILWK